MQYVYPATITRGYFDENENKFIDDGFYYVDFADLQGSHTDGDTLEEAIEMAEDLLPFSLMCLEDDKKEIPAPTPPNEVKLEHGAFVVMVKADTDAYRQSLLNKKPVTKTVSMPQWMADMAKERNISLSNFLQNALRKEFGMV